MVKLKFTTLTSFTRKRLRILKDTAEAGGVIERGDPLHLLTSELKRGDVQVLHQATPAGGTWDHAAAQLQ